VQSTFSPSSLSCFDNCPKQYHFRYVEPIPVDRESIEAFVGKRVHEILERLYQFVQRDLVPTLPRVLWRYRESFREQFDPARVRIVREGAQLDWYRSQGERGLENYYRTHYPFEDAKRTEGLERAIRFELDAAGRYPVRGVIDRLVKAPDGALEIHDFKTGRRVPTQEEVDRDRQLGLYEIGVRGLFPEANEVRLVWHYVVPNQTRTSTRSEAQREALREDTARTIDCIRSEREWAPRPSGLCDWCEFRAHCPAFGGAPPPKAAEPVAAAEAQLALPVS
jgi:putative RecB family exonuclease